MIPGPPPSRCRRSTIRSRSSNTRRPGVLTDLDAQTFVTQKFFELQARRRDHTYSLIGQPTLLPGDVVSVPSGSITYSVQIESVALNRDMSVDIQASDFQTSVRPRSPRSRTSAMATRFRSRCRRNTSISTSRCSAMPMISAGQGFGNMALWPHAGRRAGAAAFSIGAIPLRF
jgi:hypothetical protein